MGVDALSYTPGLEVFTSYRVEQLLPLRLDLDGTHVRAGIAGPFKIAEKTDLQLAYKLWSSTCEHLTNAYCIAPLRDASLFRSLLRMPLIANLSNYSSASARFASKFASMKGTFASAIIISFFL
ncbi:hypothetical protein AC578_9723 [Pseudocercospora eumusae]|uniref:Uncharacterized protein n=1 Tax=Pseudocercospora eumusae TaxID=321146 RepID=A0A139HQS2_9PEZI|nr:hypothetical protein AC578_9723 [Pseudocercospora eumusae]